MELTAVELWSRIQELVRNSVPEHTFRTWIASAKAVAATDDELVLEGQNPFHVEWLEDKSLPWCRQLMPVRLPSPLTRLTFRLRSFRRSLQFSPTTPTGIFLPGW